MLQYLNLFCPEPSEHFFSWIKQNVLLRMCLKYINVWIFYPLVHRLKPKMRMFTSYVLAGKRDVKFGNKFINNLLHIKIFFKNGECGYERCIRKF